MIAALSSSVNILSSSLFQLSCSGSQSVQWMQPFSTFFFSPLTDLYDLHLLWCHFQLPGDSSGFCTSVSRVTVCCNKLSALLSLLAGNLQLFVTTTLQTPVAHLQIFCGTLMGHGTPVENGCASGPLCEEPWQKSGILFPHKRTDFIKGAVRTQHLRVQS